MLLLEYDITKKEQVNKTIIQLKFETGDNEREYKVKGIRDSIVYAKESEGYLLGLYYLVSWKDYLKKENTWKPVLAM